MTEAYWLDDGTLDVETEDGTTVPVAGIESVQITPQVSIQRHYTGDSIKPDAKKQHEAIVNVNIGYALFDGDLIKEWLGGDGLSSTSWEDTSDPQEFEITGEFVSAGGDETIEVTVVGVTFEEMPIIDASRGEFAVWDLTGEGDDITDFDVTGEE